MNSCRRSLRRVVFPALAGLLASAAASFGELPPLISRDILFGNPEKTSPKLSPDGGIAWIADAKNVLQVWIGGQG